jgi:hypothetical protein
MHLAGSELLLSATDLANLGCRHLTHLERLRVAGQVEPPRFEDPAAPSRPALTAELALTSGVDACSAP